MDVALVFRDLQPVDLDELAWTGGPAHRRHIEQQLRRSWDGECELVVGELPNDRLVALGGVRFGPDAATLWMLSVHETWQSLGVGSALIAELERRARDHEQDLVRLTVEQDNPRAAALYRRLGYRDAGSVLEQWATDSGASYVSVCWELRKQVGELSL